MMSYNRNPSAGLLFFSPGTVQQVTRIATVADVAGSLNNTYLNIYSSGDAVHYVPWFNVDSGGTDPMLPGTTSIEIDISSGDSATVVAAALSSGLSGTFDFSSSSLANVVTAINATSGQPAYGASTPASDGAVPTNFAITTPIPGSNNSPTAPGLAGTIRYDNNFIYVCVSTNVWKRVAVSTW